MTRLLLVHNDQEMAASLKEGIENPDISVITASNGEEALLHVYSALPDIIIYDMVMEDYTGYEFLRLLKRHRETAGIEIIFLSMKAGLHRKISGRFNSALTCLEKPFDIAYITGAVSDAVKRRSVTAAGSRDNPQHFDDLTGLYNEQYLAIRLEEELAANFSLCALRMEISFSDDEKAGIIDDIVMKESAGIIRKSLRTIDITARIGDEGFLALLPHVEKSSALAYGQKIRNTIVEHPFPASVDASQLLIPMGIFCHDGKERLAAADFRRAAEGALSASKESGGIQIIVRQE